MQNQIRRVGIAMMVLFLALFAMLNWIQVFAAESIAGNPSNSRALLAEYSIKRGDILTLDFKTLATSTATKDKLKYLRTYPEGELYGQITGYYSLVSGTRGIEAAYNDQLLGQGGVISMQDIEDTFLGEGERGDDVRLSIDSRLQETARETLGEQAGSVVALDPITGEVRAMYSNPSYDPGPLASHEPSEIRSYYQTLNPRSANSPLINKALRTNFPPGSTFKAVTTAAALESGRYEPGSSFPDPDSIPLPQTDNRLTNFTNTSCTSAGQIDLFTALEISCDTTFALIGLAIPNELLDQSNRFGWNSPLPFDLTTEASQFPEIPDDSAPFRAFAGIGQGNVSATTLQMAVVAATIANDGRVPRPRLVREIIDSSGGVVERYSPETLGRATSPENAGEIERMMAAVVESGTGTAAQIPGLEVAGKTGTAQTVEGASPHAWFIAFAPVGNPRLAVAVLVENGGELGSEATGGQIAAPIAKALIERDREIRNW